MQQSLFRAAAGSQLREHCLHVFVPAKWLLATIACPHIVQYIASILAIAI